MYPNSKSSHIKSKVSKDTNKKQINNKISRNNQSNQEPNEIKQSTSTQESQESHESNKTNQLGKIITSILHIPYTEQFLSGTIMLLPNQMDNKMYLHLKSNLKEKLENKCYKNYGFISKIFSIEKTTDGIIEAEDPSCSAKFNIDFKCCLCLPMIGKEIICKIDRMNKTLISAINGPIKTIITTDKINKENFFLDMNRNIRIKSDSQVLVPEMYIRILVLSRTFGDCEQNILVIGYLQDIATSEQIKKYYDISIDSIENTNYKNNI